MKKLFAIFIIMIASSSHSFAANKDIAAIKTIIESVGLFVDIGNFDELEKLYSLEVKMDYTSLNGGEVETKSAKELMLQWAGVVPGFDLTRHEISNINVKIENEKATATADVIGDHWVGDLFWRAKGEYIFELSKNNSKWQIVAHRFNLAQETGTRDVFALAIENANRNQHGYIKRHQNK